MFSRKPKPLPDRIVVPKPMPAEIVACEDCKHLLYKKDAQVVTCITLGRYFWGPAGDRCEEDTETVYYYCPACRKPYDHVQYNRATGTTRYFRTLPAVLTRREEIIPDEEAPPIDPDDPCQDRR